jgi:hypothetical protein
MKRIVLVAIGIILLSIGAVDWAVGALVPHSRLLLIFGAVAVAAAGFLNGWQKMKEKSRLPFLGFVAVSPLEQVFDPTKPALIQQWNPYAVSGIEAWLYVLLAVVVWVALYYGLVAFLQGCNRP